MPFNSRLFLFVFLPVTLLGFQLLRRLRNPTTLKVWLIATSVIFYAVGDWAHVPLFAASITVNYLIGRSFHWSVIRKDPRKNRGVLFAGLFWNLGLLSYFKYWDFLVSVLDQITKSSLPVTTLFLPLGISFYTFTQLMFLVDSSAGLIETPYCFVDYVLFAAFFPYTVAGPLVKHEEIIPQFTPGMPDTELTNLLFACLLFAQGLFKKVVLADSLARVADPVFAMVRQGPVSALDAWTGSIAFTLQLYFDFSGYSDMAVGLGRLLGIELPYNFNSPYKAENVIDFWRRWHITLTRFLTNYIYNPLALRWTRQRMLRGQSTLQSGKEDPSAFLSLVAVPTLITMLAAGIWHGAGWTFIIFGLLHGLYIVGNQATAFLRRKSVSYISSFPRPINCSVTFLAVMVSFIFFRATDLGSAARILRGLLGWSKDVVRIRPFLDNPAMLLGVLLGTVWFLPNSQDLCRLAITDASGQESMDGNTLWSVARRYRKWWLIPLLILGPLTGVLIFSSTGGESHPFIYTRF